MSTTTIRLPEELKARIAKLAARDGTTPHGFILNAVEEKVQQVELRQDFLEEGQRRWQRFLADGKVIEWSEMREYLVRSANGEKVPQPVAKDVGSKR